MAGEFKLKIAEAVTLVTTAAALSASLGFLKLGFVFLGILALVREFSGSVGYKGPFYAAATAPSPRVDVEKGPQAAAALGCVDESSQVTSRCLIQKHPDFLFEKRKEEREERKMQEDGGDTVLRDRTAVPVHLFYLVVEGRVLGCDEPVEHLGRDRFISVRGGVLGGSRNVAPIPGEWTCPGCLRSGCWPAKKARAFDAVRHVPVPLCTLGQCRATFVLLGRRVSRGLLEGFQEMWQVDVPLRGAPLPLVQDMYTRLSSANLDFDSELQHVFCWAPDECRDSRVFQVGRVFLRLF